MTASIKVPHFPWHGPRELELPLPRGWDVEVCNMAGFDRPALSDGQIKASIANPIGTPPIRETARGKNEVAILFDDMSRCTRTASLVPFLLEELALAGISDERIRFVAANACHAPMNRSDFAKKLGDGVLARFPVYNHNPYENCTHVGTTSSGTEVLLNTEVARCDFKIAVNIACPHPLAVISGCAKMIIPGVAHIETIVANKRLKPIESVRPPQSALGSNTPEAAASPEGLDQVTPAYNDMEEAAELAGLDVAVECIVNAWGETVALFTGAMRPSHQASVREARTHYMTPMAVEKDIVIGNAFAKANEAPLALKTAVSVRKTGGDFVLLANNPDGMCVHYLVGPWGKTIGGRRWNRRPIPPQVNRLIVYTEYPEVSTLGHFGDPDKVVIMTSWADVLEALRETHGENASVAVYPSGDIAYFG